MLQQEEQSFNLRKNGLDVFDFPLHTGIQMDVDNFWWWYGSQDRNLMLAFLDGEVRIVGERYSPAHVLAVGAFEQLVESIDKGTLKRYVCEPVVVGTI